MGLLPRKHHAPAVDMPACQPIAETPERVRTRVRGQVVRMRARPTSGLPSLVVTIGDDTGAVTAVWSGRRAIGGLGLGSKIVVEGVLGEKQGGLQMMNPRLEFSA